MQGGRGACDHEVDPEKPQLLAFIDFDLSSSSRLAGSQPHSAREVHPESGKSHVGQSDIGQSDVG
jgi:hypothetical protein